ncbi:hypothetical protein C8Q78DRAFT_428932 [Trametes maxima]|nr:hypothetical protein C8Q78DRAFT_428932 [Trametes maxima]
MYTAASQVKSLIRRILHLHMSNDTALLHLLGQPGRGGRATMSFSTSHFYLTYQLKCSNAFLKAGTPNRELLYSARIGAAYFMKCRSGSEHEYIVLSVYGKGEKDVEPRLLGWLRCERTVADRDNTPLNHAKALSSTEWSSGHPGIPAQDCITVYNDGYDSLGDVVTKDPTIFCIDFLQERTFEGAPFLRDLAVAADLLTNRSPLYRLRRKQCYWFAGLLFRTIVGPQANDLRMLAQGLTPVPGNDEGHTKSNFVLSRDQPKGTFCTIFNIVTSGEIETEHKELTPGYTQRVQELQTQLAEDRAQGNMSALLEEQVEEERKKTATAEARVEALEEQLRALQAQHTPNA